MIRAAVTLYRHWKLVTIVIPRLASFRTEFLCPQTRYSTVELGYNVMKGTEYFVCLWTSVVLTEKYNVTFHSEELIGTRYLALQTRCRTNRCYYNRLWLCTVFRCTVFSQVRKFVNAILKMSSHCWTHMMTCSRPTILLKLGSKALLNNLRNLSLSHRKGLWGVWRWLRVLGLLKLASGCLRTQSRTSSELQERDKELWGILLATIGFWRIKGIFRARVQYLIASSLRQVLVRHHLYCWTMDMMMQMNCL